MVTILLVEDHPVMGRTLANFLDKQSDLQVYALVETAEHALEKLNEQNERHRVNLVLADVSLPGMNGIELVAILHKKYPQLPCLMLSGHKEQSYIRQALHAGAHGYITKGNPPAVIEGIQAIMRGEIYFSPDINRP